MRDIERLADEIINSGVTTAFGVPGGGPSLNLIDALERRGARFVTTHFEGWAAVMAGTVGRLVGKAGVSVSIKGPGLANTLPGLAACALEGFPIVAVTEAYSSSQPLAFGHKRMNHHALVQGVAKSYIEQGAMSYEHAARWASEEVPGPVVLGLTGEDETTTTKVPFPHPVQHAEAEAISLLRRAERPLVIAGTLAIRWGLSECLNDLAVPTFTSAAAKGVVDETAPHAAGIFTGTGGGLAPEARLLRRADVVIGIGLRTKEVLVAKTFHCPVINVDPLGTVESVGFDVAATMSRQRLGLVFECLQERPWGIEEIRTVQDEMVHALSSKDEFTPAAVFQTLSQQFRGLARLVLDTGLFCTVGEHVWKTSRPNLFLGSGQGRYMGLGIPMAIAAAIHDTTTPTILVVGDGGIGPAFAELKLAVAETLPLLVVLMSDGGFGSISARAIRSGLTEQPLRIARPSWSGCVSSLGIPSTEAASIADVCRAVGDWSGRAGPRFMQCHFDPVTYRAAVDVLR